MAQLFIIWLLFLDLEWMGVNLGQLKWSRKRAFCRSKKFAEILIYLHNTDLFWNPVKTLRSVSFSCFSSVLYSQSGPFDVELSMMNNTFCCGSMWKSNQHFLPLYQGIYRPFEMLDSFSEKGKCVCFFEQLAQNVSFTLSDCFLRRAKAICTFCE